MQYRTKHHLTVLLDVRDYLWSRSTFRRSWHVSRSRGSLVGIMAGGWIERSSHGRPS